jgi:hypothetical protein
MRVPLALVEAPLVVRRQLRRSIPGARGRKGRATRGRCGRVRVRTGCAKEAIFGRL